VRSLQHDHPRHRRVPEELLERAALGRARRLHEDDVTEARVVDPAQVGRQVRLADVAGVAGVEVERGCGGHGAERDGDGERERCACAAARDRDREAGEQGGGDGDRERAVRRPDRALEPEDREQER
jgi:hypothetical protein